MVNRYDLHHCVDDGDYVLYNDYAALEARVAELEMDATRYRHWLFMPQADAVEIASIGSGCEREDAIDESMSRRV